MPDKDHGNLPWYLGKHQEKTSGRHTLNRKKNEYTSKAELSKFTTNKTWVFVSAEASWSARDRRLQYS